MIEKLAESLVAWQVKKHYLLEKDRNLYTYAYELLIGQAVNVLIACLLAVLLDACLIVFVFLASFFPLRSYAGGHHADNFNICTIISTLIVCMVCIASKVIPLEAVLSVSITAGIVSGGLIYKWAPVEDQNKPLSMAEKKQYRKTSILIWMIECTIWIVSYWIGARDVSLAIALGHLLLSALLCAGVIKNKFFRKNA
ncbi:hypothetical protein ADH76_31745 [Enterocloster clostridioformis]|uniref:accessory gene regulator ArgB-like protein n=1 Tax=Enterocloster clostridioformis TaxID=1531 RepID=UPI00080C4AE0|nr:accessory gene regulator B family protein [Enterocloster clostridioformis]ANU46821.1 hypothetical protein A4V08_14365 [Lachnoclostridium sp. YL32]NDO26891.1 hypothetical protein [Enterocloster clostridioformis]OXE62412.1 hypothetical protein ADH76_31745 [Enterocloster clostridioformis]QQQ98474.1 accessory gene regulator B family protein [Enterocloster clostridioformis]